MCLVEMLRRINKFIYFLTFNPYNEWKNIYAHINDITEDYEKLYVIFKYIKTTLKIRIKIKLLQLLSSLSSNRHFCLVFVTNDYHTILLNTITNDCESCVVYNILWNVFSNRNCRDFVDDDFSELMLVDFERVAKKNDKDLTRSYFGCLGNLTIHEEFKFHLCEKIREIENIKACMKNIKKYDDVNIMGSLFAVYSNMFTNAVIARNMYKSVILKYMFDNIDFKAVTEMRVCHFFISFMNNLIGEADIFNYISLNFYVVEKLTDIAKYIDIEHINIIILFDRLRIMYGVHDFKNTTSLHLAVLFKNPELIYKIVVKDEYDIDKKNIHGQTPLDFAINRDINGNIILLLIMLEADVSNYINVEESILGIQIKKEIELGILKRNKIYIYYDNIINKEMKKYNNEIGIHDIINEFIDKRTILYEHFMKEIKKKN